MAGGFGPTLAFRAKRASLTAIGLRRCPVCDLIKGLDVYTNDKHMPGGKCSRCRDCDRKRTRGKGYARERRQNLKRRFGLTPEQFVAMRESQWGLCAACRCTLEGGIKEHVDHDHATGKVRAILCCNCNQALGHAKEDIRRLLALVDYLREHGK